MVARAKKQSVRTVATFDPRQQAWVRSSNVVPEPVQLRLQTNTAVVHLLRALLDTGLYGATIEEVAEGLIRSRLAEIKQRA